MGGRAEQAAISTFRQNVVEVFGDAYLLKRHCNIRVTMGRSEGGRLLHHHWIREDIAPQKVPFLL